MNEERLIEIETRIAYQEDTIQQLNQVVTEQQQKIEQLEKQYKTLQEYIASLPELLVSNNSADEIPPHY